jgi:phage FluMu gp28-like protein
MLDSRWTFLTREVLTIKNSPTPQQLEILLPRLQRCNRICLDATGAGIGLGDFLVQRFGQWIPDRIPSPHGRGASSSGRVELCQFTTALKAELFPRLRTAFEQRTLRIPISREIREDLHAIQRTVSLTGAITYRAPQSADGHSDRTTALALALRAAQNAPASACATSIALPERGFYCERQSPVTFRLGECY